MFTVDERLPLNFSDAPRIGCSTYGVAYSHGSQQKEQDNRGSSVEAAAPRIEYLLSLAEEELERRRIRSKYLPLSLPEGAAWAMLLELFVSFHRGHAVIIKSISLTAGVPPTTALRLLGILESNGLVERSPISLDKRTKRASLTAKGDSMVRKILGKYRQENPE
jgi:DNA-binding MarR family transcriptional regulator